MSNLAQGNAFSTLADVGECTNKLDIKLAEISMDEGALVYGGRCNTQGCEDDTADESCDVEATVANCGAGVWLVF